MTLTVPQATRGITPKSRPWYFPVGQAVHVGIQALASGSDWLAAKAAIEASWAGSLEGVVMEEDHHDVQHGLKEQHDLAIALCYVWFKERWPTFSAEYRVLAVEPELRATLWSGTSRSGRKYRVVLMSRPDLILERVHDGAIVQLELKTKAMVNDLWRKSWDRNLQVIAQQLAVREWMKENGYEDRLLGGATIETLVKGSRKRNKVGRWEQQSPLIYAYCRGGFNDPLLGPPQMSPTWKKDWDHRLASEIMPLEEWIDGLPVDERSTKCIMLPALRPSNEEIARSARAWALSAIADFEAMQVVDKGTPLEHMALLDEFFPENGEACYAKGACSYLKFCKDPVAALEDLAQAGFVQREVNHPEGDEV